MKTRLSWSIFKQRVIINKVLYYQYLEDDNSYGIWADEENITYYCTIDKTNPKSSDQIDWEDNYKSGANPRVYPRVAIGTQTKEVTTSNFGATESLDVTIHGNTLVDLPRFTPKFYASTNEIILSDTQDTQIVSLSYNGQLDYFSLLFDRDDLELILIVDTVEILRISLDDLQDTVKFNLLNTEFPITLSANGKQVLFSYSTPVDIQQSFEIKAKSTVASTTKLLSVLVGYRGIA